MSNEFIVFDVLSGLGSYRNGYDYAAQYRAAHEWYRNAPYGRAPEFQPQSRCAYCKTIGSEPKCINCGAPR